MCVSDLIALRCVAASRQIGFENYGIEPVVIDCISLFLFFLSHFLSLSVSHARSLSLFEF